MFWFKYCLTFRPCFTLRACFHGISYVRFQRVPYSAFSLSNPLNKAFGRHTVKKALKGKFNTYRCICLSLCMPEFCMVAVYCVLMPLFLPRLSVYIFSLHFMRDATAAHFITPVWRWLESQWQRQCLFTLTSHLECCVGRHVTSGLLSVLPGPSHSVPIVLTPSLPARVVSGNAANTWSSVTNATSGYGMRGAGRPPTSNKSSGGFLCDRDQYKQEILQTLMAWGTSVILIVLCKCITACQAP